MGINTIKQDYTFSGQDITVYAYRNIALENERARRKRSGASTGYQNKSRQDIYRQAQQELNFTQKSEKPLEQSGKSQSGIGKEGGGLPELKEDFTDSSNLGRGDSGISGSLDGGSKVFFELGTLDSFSFSSFREKNAIRTLGRSHALGYTRGPRTVAGSLTFNATQENELLAFFAGVDLNEVPYGNIPMKTLMLDQIDPFNVILMFSNEMGGNSVLQLFNLELSSESQRMSVHDILVQNTVNFYATDILPMQDVGNTFNTRFAMLAGIAADGTSGINNTMRKKINASIQSKTLGDEAERLLGRSRGLF